MAEMYPKIITEEKPYSEKTVFKALKEKLPRKYTVFYSYKMTDNKNIARECDFVIINPHEGFITLEIKGGDIKVQNGEWTSSNKEGHFNIKNPYEQASNAMYQLLNLYNSKFGNFQGKHYYGVGFPDSKQINTNEISEMTKTNTFFFEDIKNIDKWINRLFASHQNKDMNKETARKLVKIIKPNISIEASINSLIKQKKEEMKKINLYQNYLLDLFENKNKIAFQGAAGTGKTYIAIKKAIQLAKKKQNCLVLCYNNMLEKKLKEIKETLIDEENVNSTKTKNISNKIHTFTFHSFANHIFIHYLKSITENNIKQTKLFNSLANDICQKQIDVKQFINTHIYKKDRPNTNKIKTILEHYGKEGIHKGIYQLLEKLLIYENEEEYFDYNIPIGLECILEDNCYKIPQYDAILVDEGQDFQEPWCDCLKYFFEKANTNYIFYDDNQNIFAKTKQLPIIELINKNNIEPYLFKLRTNIRNTKEIHHFAINKTNMGKTAKSTGIEGITPNTIIATSYTKVKIEIKRILNTLINKHNIKNEQILVLSSTAIRNSIFKENKNIDTYTLTEAGKGIKGKYIKLRSIKQFKGLETDVAILVIDNDSTENMKELLYVGYTRARFLLYVIKLDII